MFSCGISLLLFKFSFESNLILSAVNRCLVWRCRMSLTLKLNRSLHSLQLKTSVIPWTSFPCSRNLVEPRNFSGHSGQDIIFFCETKTLHQIWNVSLFKRIILQDRRHQWSSRRNLQSLQKRSLFSLENCFIFCEIWKVCENSDPYRPCLVDQLYVEMF